MTDRPEPYWVLPAALDAIHQEQLAEHGGSPGIRDQGLLESALARPRNLYAYGESDLHTLAAAHAFGLAKNHPYIDGNKRTAFLAAYLFLGLNGLALHAPEDEAIQSVLGPAAGTLTDAAFSSWLRANTRKS